MSVGWPQGAPQAGEPITVSRPLTADEALTRLQLGRRAVMTPILNAVMGGGLALVVVATGLLTDGSLGWVAGISLGYAAIAGIAATLGFGLGNGVTRQQARDQLGESSVLTVTWSASGGQVSAENVQRTFRYQEIRWIREVDGCVVVRLPMQRHTLVLPSDFVPDQVKQQIVAAGVRLR